MSKLGAYRLKAHNNWIDSHVLRQRQAGFTLAEVLISLIIVTTLLLSASSVVSTSTTTNGKAALEAEASEQAFKKIQDYINTEFDTIPIGDDLTSYEVEDFSSEVTDLGNPVAKVHIEPASVVDTMTTYNTTNYTETVNADPTYTSGSQITSVGTIDPTNTASNDWRIRDGNNFNLVYNNHEPGTSNQPMPGIDLGSSKAVDTIRINWYSSYYTASNFRIEGSNNGSSWTTVASGLSQTSSVGTGIGNYPEDYSVSGTYRYWRMFVVTGTHSTWIAISEFEAFTAGSGDVVEQQGSDASASPGALDFTSSDLDMSENGTQGHQSIGLRFNDVNVEQGVTIDSAHIQFTADETDSGTVTLLVTGVDTDDATGWSGTYAVDNAISGSGTSASTTWSPPAWTASDDSEDQQADVTSIVQEILNRGGWSDGNSMAFGIQYVSGSAVRVAERTPVPELVIDWSETVAVSGGGYIDDDMDGDADNPTLLKITARIEYDSFGKRDIVEYSTFIRQYGLGS